MRINRKIFCLCNFQKKKEIRLLLLRSIGVQRSTLTKRPPISDGKRKADPEEASNKNCFMIGIILKNSADVFLKIVEKQSF